MRNYHINFNRIVNQLTPYYLGGRKYILFVQSLLSPLQSLASQWYVWAVDTMEKAKLTSQVIFLERYLNHKFSQYFQDPKQRIYIAGTEMYGVKLFWEFARKKVAHTPFYDQRTHALQGNVMFYQNERQKYTGVSFLIYCPPINTGKISIKDMTNQIEQLVEPYCLAGKKFKINYMK